MKSKRNSKRLARLLAILFGCALSSAVADISPAMAACQGGQIAVAETCVAAEEVNAKIDAIVRQAMAKHHLKAVIAGVAIGDQPPSIKAWGESMTGVAATPDMHFRNGAVAIAYIGTVLLQLHDQGAISVHDKLGRGFRNTLRRTRSRS